MKYMRQRFSVRNKIIKPRDVLQLDDIDNALRNRLWNSFKNTYIEPMKTGNWNVPYKLDNY